MHALRHSLRSTDTLVLVTHKGELLDLVDRLIVIANHQIVMDGPKEQVLARLQTPPAQPTPNPANTAPNAPPNTPPKVTLLKLPSDASNNHGAIA
jgi:ATP-binding cassette subfamily C protein LapB